MITHPVLTRNDSKRILPPKRRFGTRFGETVITSAVLTQYDAKRTLHQKRRFGTRFGETVITLFLVLRNFGKFYALVQ